MFVVNEVLSINKLGDVEGNNELIEIIRKLLKSRKTSKNEKLFKS